MEQKILNRVVAQTERFNRLLSSKTHIEATLIEAHNSMARIVTEQSLLERTTVALQQAKPLLSASSIKQCENLANTAISSIFGEDWTVQWDVESRRFVLNKDGFQSDLIDGEGGGVTTVISLVFSVYLLVKMGKRKFIAFDEAFYAVSEKYFTNFVQFVRQLCHDLGVDLVLISHDNRITMDDVDHCYLIEGGHTKRLK